MSETYTRVTLKDGRSGVVVDRLGNDYVVEVGTSPDDWDTVLVKPEDLEATDSLA